MPFADSSLMPRCPVRLLLLQNQISNDNRKLETGHDVSKAEPLSTKISAESSVNCGMSLSVRSGLQAAADVSRVLKHTGRMLHGPVRTASDAHTRNAQRLTPLKNEYTSKRRYHTGSLDYRETKPHTDHGSETGLTQEASDTLTQTASNRPQRSSNAQSEGEQDTAEVNAATETAADLPDYTLDNVRLTEMELETCKRLDILARNRERHRTGGRRRTYTVTKDQNAVSADRKPPEVETNTGLPKEILGCADFGTESTVMLECSGDRIGGGTFRICSGVKPSQVGEQTEACTSAELETAETTQAKRVLRSGSNGLPSDAPADLPTTEENKNRFKPVAECAHVCTHRRSKIQNSDQRNSFSSEAFTVSSPTANARNENKPSSARLHNTSSISSPKNVISSYSTSSSRPDSFALATTTSGNASKLGTFVTTSDQTDVKDKRGQRETCASEEPFDTRKASYANVQDKTSGPSADVDSADSTTSGRKRHIRKEVPTPFGDHPSSNLTGNVKETLQAVVKQQQMIVRETTDPSTQEAQSTPSRPIRSSTIIIEAGTAHTWYNPDCANDHTCGSSRTHSPLRNDRTFEYPEETERHQDGRLSGTSTFAAYAKTASNCKVRRSSRHPSPTKSSELRRNLRRPVQCHARKSNRHGWVADRDGCGATLCAKLSTDIGQTVQDNYAKLQKAQSIPAQFKLKAICREIDTSNDETNLEFECTKYSQKYRIKTDRMRFSCVSEASRDTATSTNIMAASPTSKDSRIISTPADDKFVVRSATDLTIASTEECFPTQSRKNGEKSNTSVHNDANDMNKSPYQTVSYRGQKGRKSPTSCCYGGQENFFPSTTRTFLVSSPGRIHSHPSITARRKSPRIFQNTKRTFLVGQSCMRKLPTRYPRDNNTTGSKPKCFPRLSDSLSHADSRNINGTNQAQRSEMIRKHNYPSDKKSSPQISHKSTPKENLVTCSYSAHPSNLHTDASPVCQHTPARPHSHSTSPMQSQQYCSTPVLGSTRPMSPLFYSPIPFHHSPKRPAFLAKTYMCSPNMSSTICSSPITPYNLGNLQTSHPYDAFPNDTYTVSTGEDVSDGSRESQTKEKPSAEHTPLKHLTHPSCVVTQFNNTYDTDPTERSSNNKSSAFNTLTLSSRGEDFPATDQSWPTNQKSNDKSSLSLTHIFYRNHSQAVDAILPNGRRSNIPQACWHPYHIIPAGTDVSSFRLRIHYEEVPPRSFRYSRFHRKAIEGRFPECIRRLPILLSLKRVSRTKK